MDWLTASVIVASLLVGAAAGLLLASVRRRSALQPDDRLEQQAREGERLMDVGRVAGGLMHEIKNPLSTLHLNLQLLAEDFARPETDLQRRTARKLQVLRDETRHLEEILNTFMVFVGRMELRKSRLDAGRLVADLLTFYEPQAAQHRLTLRSTIESGLPAVDADADLLKQALLNLILNAQAAMPDGGELMLSVRRDGQAVAITVTDTGCGIPAQQLGRIFEAYYSTRQGGTGLGLPIVKRIVAEHGGAVAVASEPGRGTQFVIRLPAAEDAHQDNARE